MILYCSSLHVKLFVNYILIIDVTVNGMLSVCDMLFTLVVCLLYVCAEWVAGCSRESHRDQHKLSAANAIVFARVGEGIALLEHSKQQALVKERGGAESLRGGKGAELMWGGGGAQPLREGRGAELMWGGGGAQPLREGRGAQPLREGG